MGEPLAVATKTPDGDITQAQLSRIISVTMADAGIGGVADLVRWFDDGREHLLDNPTEAARELGTTPSMVTAILSSQAFRQAYLQHEFNKAFNPRTLASGLALLAADFTDPEREVRERLAIFRTVRDMAGVAEVKKVETETTSRHFEFKVTVATTPNDFVNEPSVGGADATAKQDDGPVVHEVQAVPVIGAEDFVEAEEEREDGEAP